uniref:Uncharacterized protein n=1 Tax=mine drainage metagenome TaxID=410659 RepID=E6QK27_9ZZZZ
MQPCSSSWSSGHSRQSLYSELLSLLVADARNIGAKELTERLGYPAFLIKSTKLAKSAKVSIRERLSP